MIATELLVLAFTHAGKPLWLAECGLTLTGIGMGMNTGPLMSVATDAVTAARSGTAAALINVARMAGTTVGVAILGSVFALFHAGPEGFRFAMLTGAVIQIGGAATAWLLIR